MQKFRRTTIFLLLCLCAPPVWAAASFDGDWVGGFERSKGQVYVHVHLGTTTNRTTGTIDVLDPLFKGRLPQLDMKLGYVRNTWLISRPLDTLELASSHLHFELADKDSLMSFDGQVTNGVMTGTMEDRGMKLPFRLDLTARIDPSRYTGIYQVGPAHFIAIAPDAPGLLFFDAQSGQMGLLVPRSDTDFAWGLGVKIYQVQANIHFTTNRIGQVTALQWKSKNASAVDGHQIKLPEEEVSITNGDVILAGTLVLPPTKSPHPAVVIDSGSAPWVRSDLRGEADFFALNGIAALVYDKRGCGRSTGDLSVSGFDNLASDALAGLELLKNRTDINPHQIGLSGSSQGGWIVSLAASRCRDVAFIISVSGPGITPEATSAYSVEHWMKAEGYSATDVDEARSLYLLSSRYMQTGRNWNEVEAARKADQNKPWYNANYLLCNDASGIDKQWQLIANYDPVPALRKVHCPVLSIYGESDPIVPAKESANIWKTALSEAGNQDVVIKIFPHADHVMQDIRTGLPVPGLWTLQHDWLLKHVTVND